MVDSEMKEAVKGKLNFGSSITKDIQESKVKVRIEGVEKVDGKIKANYYISGLPTKKENESSSQDIPKIFNSINEFSTYTKKMFGMDDDDIVKMIRGTGGDKD